MTIMIAGSIILIAASSVALVLGWVGANETLIWVSIAASVGSAVCLALAYYKSKTPTGKVTPPSGRKS